MPRLNSRLTKLEQAGSQESVDADSMLVEILGRRDALMYPWRTVSDQLKFRARGAIRERQQKYLDGRLGFSARATGKDGWKDAYEQRGQLITSGLALPMRSGGEITGLKLTPQGEADARALVGSRLKTLRDPEVLAILHRCLMRQDEMSQWVSVVHGPARYAVEWLVYGLDEPLSGNPVDWEQLTELTQPLLTAGYLQASSDSEGRVYFSLIYNDKGQPAFDKVEFGPVSERQADPKFDEIYINAFDAERMALEQLESSDLVIPVPCSGTWMEWQTRAVKMRDAIRYPSVTMKPDFSGAGYFKDLADQALADQASTDDEKRLASELLAVIANKSAEREAKAKELANV